MTIGLVKNFTLRTFFCLENKKLRYFMREGTYYAAKTSLYAFYDGEMTKDVS